MERKWLLAFGLAIVNDVLDWTGAGIIPVLGDVIDLATSGLLWRVIGTRKTAFTLLELIPGADILPIHLLAVTWAYYREELDGLSRES